MIKILQKEAKELRRNANPVAAKDIGSPRLNKIIQKLKNALEEQEDGVAIAAPQIGENISLFVVSKRAYEMKEGKAPKSKKSSEFQDKVFINPQITKVSKEKEMMDEGCLSVRWLYGRVLRSTKATIEAMDENGKKFSMGGSGLIAQIFQHECDHLEGILFIDEAVDVEEIPPEALKKELKKIK